MGAMSRQKNSKDLETPSQKPTILENPCTQWLVCGCKVARTDVSVIGSKYNLSHEILPVLGRQQ
jgi:hypothetical protein